MKRKIIPITLASLLLAVSFDILFYGKEPGISVLIFTLLTLGTTLFLAERFTSRLNRSVYWLMPLVVFFALMVFVRTSEMLTFFNIMLGIYLLLLIVKLAGQPDKRLGEYVLAGYFSNIPTLPIKLLGAGARELRTGFHPKVLDNSTYRPVLRGIAISLPLLVIFGLLFASADMIFQRFITGLFDIHLDDDFIARTIIISLVATAFVGAFAILFIRKFQPKDSTLLRGLRADLGATETSIILGSVGTLFFVFILFQLAYFFGGSDRVLSSGLTYAEYARRGFFELIAVAVIALLLILGIKKSATLTTGKHTRIFQWLSGILIVEVLVIMLSAHLRLSLYEQAYGFTLLRLLSHMFIGWLAVAFLLLLIYIIRQERERQFAFRIFVSVIAFFAVLNISNPEAVIARQNIARLQTTGKLDVSYLSHLSEDATPTTLQLLDSRDPEVRLQAAGVLARQKASISCKNDSWQSANLSRMRAEKLLGQTEPLTGNPERSCEH